MTSTRVLQRVIFPEPFSALETWAAYARGQGSMAEDVVSAPSLAVDSRTSATLSPHSRVSFDAFFNAFPASYWRRWTPIPLVLLRLTTSGSARVDVYRSNGRGRVIHVEGRPVVGDGVDTTFELPLEGLFLDGGYYWFSVSSGDRPFVLDKAEWCSGDPVELRPCSIGICTYNRAKECTETLAALTEDPFTLAAVRRIYIADQGTVKLRSVPGFSEVAAKLGDRLVVVEQANLGGSGGFSRVMYEVLQSEDAGDVILMDDDIKPEPESVPRSIAFGSAAGGRVLVHGHMFDLWSVSRLHNTGDVVDFSDVRPRAADEELQDFDLTENPLAATPQLHRRFDSVFGGWWMCLVPREALLRLGLSLPFFIKWDDIEYGLRARDFGYSTVTLPGAGVWHMPFHVKDVQTDWTAYFECRNRLTVALLYGTDRSIRGAIFNNFQIVVKNLLSMNYSAVRLHQLAIDDLMRGPDFMFDDLPNVVGRVRAARQGFDDAMVLDAVPGTLSPTMDLVALTRLAKEPTNWFEARANIVRGVSHAALPLRRKPKVADVTGFGSSWSLLSRLDEAAVASSDGAGVAVRVRDDALLRQMLTFSVRQHMRLLRSADELRRSYRDALPRLTDAARWARLFDTPNNSSGS